MISLEDFINRAEEGPGGIKVEAALADTTVISREEEADTVGGLSLREAIAPQISKTPAVLLTG